MGATTTAFKSLLKHLQTDFPELVFDPGDSFHWSASAKTVYYDQKDMKNASLLLHEAAHGVLGHESYSFDIDLIKLEREAWKKAAELGEHYGFPVTEDEREDGLDTYREWLHARSTCPVCTHNGIQTGEDVYECVVCAAKWHVNDARTCGLKRNTLTT